MQRRGQDEALPWPHTPACLSSGVMLSWSSEEPPAWPPNLTSTPRSTGPPSLGLPVLTGPDTSWWLSIAGHDNVGKAPSVWGPSLCSSEEYKTPEPLVQPGVHSKDSKDNKASKVMVLVQVPICHQ